MKRDHKKLRDTAIALAAKRGLANLSLDDVCRSARVSPGSFKHITGLSFGDFIAELHSEGHDGPAEAITKSRIAPAFRREAILDAALRVTDLIMWSAITRDEVAIAAGVSPALISYHFGTTALLRDAIMAEAVKRGVLHVIAQGLAVSHPVAQRAPEALRSAAAAHITGVRV